MLINLSLLTLQGHHAEVWCIISHGDISVQQAEELTGAGAFKIFLAL
jgi:hypothetical protein